MSPLEFTNLVLVTRLGYGEVTSLDEVSDQLLAFRLAHKDRFESLVSKNRFSFARDSDLLREDRTKRNKHSIYPYTFNFPAGDVRPYEALSIGILNELDIDFSQMTGPPIEENPDISQSRYPNGSYFEDIFPQARGYASHLLLYHMNEEAREIYCSQPQIILRWLKFDVSIRRYPPAFRNCLSFYVAADMTQSRQDSKSDHTRLLQQATSGLTDALEEDLDQFTSPKARSLDWSLEARFRSGQNFTDIETF